MVWVCSICPMPRLEVCPCQCTCVPPGWAGPGPATPPALPTPATLASAPPTSTSSSPAPPLASMPHRSCGKHAPVSTILNTAQHRYCYTSIIQSSIEGKNTKCKENQEKNNETVANEETRAQNHNRPTSRGKYSFHTLSISSLLTSCSRGFPKVLMPK